MILVATTLFYAPWLPASLNTEVRWLGYAIAAANLFTLTSALLTVFNVSDPGHGPAPQSAEAG